MSTLNRRLTRTLAHLSRATHLTTHHLSPSLTRRHIMNEIVPLKSPSDERTYKILTLPNALECILVLDPLAEKAAAAMSVRVGHFADPPELPGLAHFLEHMLTIFTNNFHQGFT